MRLEARCASGFFPRSDMTGFGSRDPDAALADLHYAGRRRVRHRLQRLGGLDRGPGRRRPHRLHGFPPDRRSRARRAERDDHGRRVRDGGPGRPRQRRAPAPSPTRSRTCQRLYETWIASQEAGIPAIAGAPRQATAKRLSLSARQARDRIAAGVELLRTDPYARLAFRAMNEAVARAARQREAILNGGDPAAQRKPKWRPFQLAFILLNLCGPAGPAARRPRDRRPAVLPDRRRQDRGLSRPRRLDDRASPYHQFAVRSAPASRC